MNASNNTGITSTDFFSFDFSVENIILTVLYVPIFTIGFGGNTVFTVLIATNKKLGNAANYYFFNLALTDMSGKNNFKYKITNGEQYV